MQGSELPSLYQPPKHPTYPRPSPSQQVSCMQGSELPSLYQSRLSAPRILPAHKVASYIQGKLQDLGQPCAMPDLWLDPSRRRPSIAAQVGGLLLCLPPPALHMRDASMQGPCWTSVDGRMGAMTEVRRGLVGGASAVWAQQRPPQPAPGLMGQADSKGWPSSMRLLGRDILHARPACQVCKGVPRFQGGAVQHTPVPASSPPLSAASRPCMGCPG